MHGTEHEPRGAQLSIGWQDAVLEQSDQSLERAAAYAAILTRTLVAAGYQPRRLDIGLRLGAHGVLEMRVHGDVPRMPEPDFASLARVTLHAATLAQDMDGLNDVLLVATLESDVGIPDKQLSPRPATLRERLRSWPLGRLATALVLGGVLGVLGLPRLELPSTAPSAQPRAVVVIPDLATPAAQTEPTSIPALPTPIPALASPTGAQPPTATPNGSRVLIAQQLTSPLPNWPNDPNGTAWFGDGGFHLLARQPGRFVAVGVPQLQVISSAVITAEFRKVGGPAGGGYGLIIRDQGSSAERDGRNQAGQYLVLEVGDRGDVGIWLRNEARWIDVLPWTHSELVHTDHTLNALVIMMRGNALRFEVNGEAVADLTYDAVPPRGGVGVFVGGDLNEAVLEWLRIELS